MTPLDPRPSAQPTSGPRAALITLSLLLATGCSRRQIEDILEGNQLGSRPPCSSTFGFAPPLGPTRYSAHQIDHRIERRRCDASPLGKGAAVEKIVEIDHVTSTTKAPGPGSMEVRIDLLFRAGGQWTRVPIDSGATPGDSGYAGSATETEFAERRFEIAEGPARVAIVELPSKVKVPGRAWIAERVAGKTNVREVPDAPTAAALLARP